MKTDIDHKGARPARRRSRDPARRGQGLRVAGQPPHTYAADPTLIALPRDSFGQTAK